MEGLLGMLGAFVIYVALIYGTARLLAGKTRRTALYAGGEEHPPVGALPGYAPFFVFALFFAVLHLGALLLASGTPSPLMLVFIIGLALSLLALLLG